MSVPNFELVTELQTLTRRDFPLADSTLLAPLTTGAIIDGEWLNLNASYQLARETVGVGGTHEGNKATCFPVHTERGRYDTQAIGKANVLMLGMYEAETRVVGSSYLSAAAVGDFLTVQDVSYAGYATRRGLGVKTGAAVVVVGVVSRVVAGSGKIRFVHFGNMLHA